MAQKDSISKEWFDREYTGREVYARLYRRAKRYRPIILVGLVAGMFVGGTWLPIFQMLKPAITQMQDATPSHPASVEVQEFRSSGVQKEGSIDIPVCAQEILPPEAFHTSELLNSRTPELPSYFYDIDDYAKRYGINIMAEDGSLRSSFFTLMLIVLLAALLFRVGMI